MNDLENTLRGLKLKRVLLLTQIESLSEVSPDLYTTLGKVEYEIVITERQLVRATENSIE